MTKTEQAVRLVIDQGYSQSKAAKEVGINRAAVSRAITKLTGERRCPCCGQIRRPA